ncbi:MAG: glycosyltransferase family A protein [Ignavibacterium sp.]|jgi:glycosyltransferase involved in cell wall biosynthesis|nr:glycosyltransferase family A protein [Ignavibacterium sp.]
MSDALKNQPLVSVIIPGYNCEEFIEQTIKSVLNQTYQNYEIIFVDDGSTDKTIKLVEKLAQGDTRIKIFILEHAGRPSVPRNYGVKKSSGDFIAFLDADDLWTKDKLDYQLNYLINNTQISLVYSMCFTFGKVNFFSEMFELLPLPFRAARNREDLIKIGNTIPLSSVLIRKKAFEEAGGFDEDPDDKLEDYGLWLEVSKDHSIHFIPRVHVYYRIHENQFSSDWISKEKSLKYLARKKNIELNSYKYYRKKGLLFLLVRNSLHYLIYITYKFIGYFDNRERLSEK